ncbi:MAG: GNAT family N-acetyltransferase [Methylocystis sp.]
MVIKLETPVDLDEPLFDVFDRLSDAREDWLTLFENASYSPYQNYDYVDAWFETIGKAREIHPMIVVARDPDGAPIALFPLATRDAFGVRVAEFPCGRESNLNLWLCRSGTQLDARALLLAAARGRSNPPDLFHLRNQPRRFGAFDNPLAAGDASPSPSFAYGAALPADIEALDNHVSKASKKKLRQKEKRLKELGSLSYEHAATGARAREIVATLIEQKSARLARAGMEGVFTDPGMRAFFERACDMGAVEAHAMRLSGRVVATYIGLPGGGRFSGLANSFDTDAEIARCSPGDILLHALLRNLVERGFTSFDLGVGEARYKDAVCDETIELYDLVLPVSNRGALAAVALRGFLRWKRLAKHTPWLLRLVSNGRLSRLVRWI